MDGLTVAGVVICLVLALGLAICFLVAYSRRTRRQRGAAGQIVTVSELLENAIQNGEPIRLNWTRDDLDSSGCVRSSAQHHEFPTAVLPKISDFDD